MTQDRPEDHPAGKKAEGGQVVHQAVAFPCRADRPEGHMEIVQVPELYVRGKQEIRAEQGPGDDGQVPGQEGRASAGVPVHELPCAREHERRPPDFLYILDLLHDDRDAPRERFKVPDRQGPQLCPRHVLKCRGQLLVESEPVRHFLLREGSRRQRGRERQHDDGTCHVYLPQIGSATVAGGPGDQDEYTKGLLRGFRRRVESQA